MSDGVRQPAPDDEPGVIASVAPEDVESAGRSCLVILLLGAAILLLLCVGIAARWALAS